MTEVFSHILVLVEIDVKKTAQLVFQHAGPDRIPALLDRLRPQPAYFDFLTHLLEMAEASETARDEDCNDRLPIRVFVPR